MKPLFKLLYLSLLIANTTQPEGQTSWFDLLLGTTMALSGAGLLYCSKIIYEKQTDNFEKYLNERTALMKMGAYIEDHHDNQYHYIDNQIITIPMHRISLQLPQRIDQTKLNAIQTQFKKIEELHVNKNGYNVMFPLSLGGGIVLLIGGYITATSKSSS